MQSRRRTEKHTAGRDGETHSRGNEEAHNRGWGTQKRTGVVGGQRKPQQGVDREMHSRGGGWDIEIHSKGGGHRNAQVGSLIWEDGSMMVQDHCIMMAI